MNEQEFIRKIAVLNTRLLDEYWHGYDLDEDIRAIGLLCHNFLEIKKMKSKDKKINNGG